MKNIHHHKDKKFVNNVFNDVYKNYDLMNDIMSFGTHRLWKEEFINSLDLNLKYKIVDMASGTGDISRCILKKNKNHQIYRIEPNFNMLNHNIFKFKNYSNVQHICSHGENIPLKDQIIDAYLISFGLRNVSKIDTVLSEAFRVLKKGGGFFCLEFYKFDRPVLGKLYKLYSKTIPFFGKIFNQNSNPYEYLVQSIEDFHSQTVIKNKLIKAGFKNINIKNIFGGIASIHYAWKLND